MKAAWWKPCGNRGNTSGGISEDAAGSLKSSRTIQQNRKKVGNGGTGGGGLMELCTKT